MEWVADLRLSRTVFGNALPPKYWQRNAQVKAHLPNLVENSNSLAEDFKGELLSLVERKMEEGLSRSKIEKSFQNP